ncbi:MAG: hypothetical protein BGO43_01390 [Gammaproteobacteria bacterium 39-13]|nr:PilW family protein [Gammaproteobacteria bacterium]OJV85958.1 MAG: hypothetical protein BGO43_01390 [Gammaproteobacteria bacterium 39-13]
MKSIKGMTLVELMISVTLGVIVVGASLQVFLTFKQVYMTQQGLARIQENARILNMILGEVIQASGNIGCNAFREDISFYVPPHIDSIHFGLERTQRIRGISIEALKSDPISYRLLSKRISPDSDILWVKTIKKNRSLIHPASFLDAVLWIKGPPKLYKNQILCLSDCSHADFIKVYEDVNRGDRYSSVPIKIFPGALSKQYGQGASIGVLSSTFFYVGKTNRNNQNGYPVMALYSTDLNGRTLELIEGVEHFEVRYGVKVKEKIIYFAHHQVSSWQEVVSVRILALLNSIEDGLKAPKFYQFRDKNVMPSDRLIRMWWAFEWTIKGIM